MPERTLDRKALAAAALSLAAMFLLLFLRLSSFGIWDPWELGAADLARSLASSESVKIDHAPLASWLIAASFKLFGVHEWSGRLPIALAGLLTLGVTYRIARTVGDRRTAIYASLVALSSPLFLLNARQMLGDSPAMLSQSLIALCALHVVYESKAPLSALEMRVGGSALVRRLLWGAGLVASLVLGTLSAGVLLGVLPPLLAVTCAALLSEDAEPLRARVLRAAPVGVIALLASGWVATAYAMQTGEAYSHALGGVAAHRSLATYEQFLEQIFHGFAPWSAVLVLGIGAMLLKMRNEAGEPSDTATADAAVDSSTTPRSFFFLWAAFGYAAHSLYAQQFGGSAYLPVAALSIAVACFLRDSEKDARPFIASGLIVALFTGLVLRDFDLYPSSPIHGLGLDGATVPEAFNPRKWWAIVLLPFALSSALLLSAAPGGDLNLKALPAWFGEQWRKDRAHKAWLILLAAICVGLLIFGLLCFIPKFGQLLGLTSLVMRIARVLMVLPIAGVVGLLGLQIALWGAGKVVAYRGAIIVVAGLIVGGYSSLGFLPALSKHMSPREVYDSYNALAHSGEPLGEYRVSGRAAAYYAHGHVQEIKSQSELIEFLMNSGRHWAVFPTDDLPAINRAFRERTQQHLFVADARSARVVLATNQPVAGRKNENFIAQSVLDSVPTIQHRVDAKYEDKIVLLGYDLDVPHPNYVGPGETFKIKWYWQVTKAVPGSFKLFLHVDGAGNRLNGDHDPVDGKYPVRLWSPGDIVVDEQELSVPANYRAGLYTLFVGFYSGSTRLKVVEGPKDDADRVRAGTVTIR